MNASAIPSNAKGDNGWTRELVSGALSFTIVAFTLYLLFAMFTQDVTNQTQWEHRSAVLNVAIGFAATVIGYYFGRVPAERAANAARQEAAQNAQARQNAVESESRLRAQLDALHADLMRGDVAASGDIARRVAGMAVRAE